MQQLDGQSFPARPGSQLANKKHSSDYNYEKTNILLNEAKAQQKVHYSSLHQADESTDNYEQHRSGKGRYSKSPAMSRTQS